MQHAFCMYIKLITCNCTAPSLVKWWLLKFCLWPVHNGVFQTSAVTLRLTDIQQVILEVTEGFLDVIRQVLAQVRPGSGQQGLHGLTDGQPCHPVVWRSGCGGGVLASRWCDRAPQVPWKWPSTDHRLGAQQGEQPRRHEVSWRACFGWLTFVDLVVTDQ